MFITYKQQLLQRWHVAKPIPAIQPLAIIVARGDLSMEPSIPRVVATAAWREEIAHVRRRFSLEEVVVLIGVSWSSWMRSSGGGGGIFPVPDALLGVGVLLDQLPEHGRLEQQAERGGGASPPHAAAGTGRHHGRHGGVLPAAAATARRRGAVVQQERVADSWEHLGRLCRVEELLGRSCLHQERRLRVEGGRSTAGFQPCDVGPQVEVGHRVHAFVLYRRDVVCAGGFFLSAWIGAGLFFVIYCQWWWWWWWCLDEKVVFFVFVRDQGKDCAYCKFLGKGTCSQKRAQFLPPTSRSDDVWMEHLCIVWWNFGAMNLWWHWIILFLLSEIYLATPLYLDTPLEKPLLFLW